MRLPWFLLLLLILPIRAWAAPSPFDACDGAIVQAERELGVPANILPSIGRVESGRPDLASGRVRPWPWTIDVQGQGQWFETKAAAVAAVLAWQAKGIVSIDVGCMQVNLQQHPLAFANLEQAFDPAANAIYGARFLSALHRQTGDWAQAVAFYHSQTPALGAAYRQRVLAGLGAAPALKLLATGPYAAWPPPGLAYAAIPSSTYAYQAFSPRRVALPAEAPRHALRLARRN